MNASKLYLESGKFAGVWFCQTCKKVARGQGIAESCCTCRHCGKECPRDSGDFTRMHRDCWIFQQTERERERLEAAEDVSDNYDGAVFVGDDFYSSIEEAEDQVPDIDTPVDELPQWAFCAKPVHPRRMNVGQIVEWMADGMYEDAYDDFCKCGELQKALDTFWQDNKHLVTWVLDPSKKVRLRYEWLREEAANQ